MMGKSLRVASGGEGANGIGEGIDMDLFQKYKSMNLDGSFIRLAYSEIEVPYFCYPADAKVIGFEGCILYCFLPEYGDMVFAANPESCADKHVYPLAESFQDFMRLVIACGSANPVEQIASMSKEQFERHLQEERDSRTGEQTELIERLRKELQLSPMDNPYEYVKALQAKFDDSSIHYSDEYYETLGLKAPEKRKGTKEEHCFESVLWKVRKKHGFTPSTDP